MPEKNLLVIVNDFPNQDNSYIVGIFVKEQLKSIKNYFDNIYVISPVAFGMELMRKIPNRDYQYDNIKIFFPKYLNFPLFYFKGRSIWVALEKRAILSVIQREKITFDLIHAHYTWPSGAVSVEFKKIFNVPVVITEHTHIALYKELARKERVYINTLKNCDAIIRVNKNDIPLFHKLGITEKKIHYIANGYDPKKFFPISKEKACKSLNLPLDKKIILNISRLSEEKGQTFLISAIADIVHIRKDCICYIGGYGPARKKLETQIKEAHLKNYVNLIGFIPDNEMALWINACDVFVLPSLSEGNPTVMFETLGCGKPFLGTKVGGESDIIISDNLGLLVEPGNSAKIIEMILMALNHEWDRDAILAYAERYTWENIARQIIVVYKQILST
jgi:teichuronic acid biosynthesis glycosyltransferase TuaC